MPQEYLKKLEQATQYIESKINTNLQVGMILGSGLGAMAEEIDNPIIIDYKDIPNFPVSTVEGHAGKLVIGELQGKNVLILQGRFHFYEGYNMQDVVFPVRVMKLLGINKLIVTNAAGGVNENFKAGDLMIINDHINFMGTNPLIGQNIDKFGLRFPDMTYSYDRKLIKIAKKCAHDLEIEVKEGVYAAVTGPCYETPAEVRMFRTLGADAVGMSTVPEVIVARHSGKMYLVYRVLQILEREY